MWENVVENVDTNPQANLSGLFLCGRRVSVLWSVYRHISEERACAAVCAIPSASTGSVHGYAMNFRHSRFETALCLLLVGFSCAGIHICLRALPLPARESAE